ncbi:MAG: hypothetical protein CM1200mP26_30640 [Acidimicrobiales bacterium]|nr:MAG: hypothetical protein CM1200mP26_30640 [Acidimicrobiales bacterium]
MEPLDLRPVGVHFRSFSRRKGVRSNLNALSGPPQAPVGNFPNMKGRFCGPDSVGVRVVLVVLYRRRGVGRVDVGTMVRRFLEYGFLYGLVMVSAIGARGVLGRFLGLISDSDVGGPEELALWLSLLLWLVVPSSGWVSGCAGGFPLGPDRGRCRRLVALPGGVDLTAVGFVVAGSIQAIGWLLDGWNSTPGCSPPWWSGQQSE